MPVQMTPLGPAAAHTILVGDPRRAFALAQELMVQPKMTHQARGLWGYSGVTDDDRPLTVQSTGSGGPSAAPVIGDLAGQGAGLMVRLGTCLATDPAVEAGTLVLVERAVPNDGVSRLLEKGDFIRPDPRVFEALDGLGRSGIVSSHDLVRRLELDGPDPGPAIVRDLQTAATLAMCRRLSVPAAALLLVAEDGSGRRLDEEELWDLFRSAGRAVVSRLNRLDPIPEPQVEA